MTQKELILITVIGLFAVGFYYFVFLRKPSEQFAGENVEIKIANTVINAEVAITEAQRAKGLMGRESLDENKGMLFVFPKEGKHTFWMANTKIALDIIWIDSSYNIVYINENTPPCTKTGNLKSYCTTYKPNKNAKYVLEVNAGFVKRYNISANQKINIINTNIRKED